MGTLKRKLAIFALTCHYFNGILLLTQTSRSALGNRWKAPCLPVIVLLPKCVSMWGMEIMSGVWTWAMDRKERGCDCRWDECDARWYWHGRIMLRFVICTFSHTQRCIFDMLSFLYVQHPVAK